MAAARQGTQWCDDVATALCRSVCGGRTRLSASRPTNATSVAIHRSTMDGVRRKRAGGAFSPSPGGTSAAVSRDRAARTRFS